MFSFDNADSLLDNKISAERKAALAKNGMTTPLAVNLVADSTVMSDIHSQPNSSKGLNNPILERIQGLFS